MDKILMIKEVRNLTGCGLKESKDIVESWQGGELPEQKELIAMVAERVKDRVPRSEAARQHIRNNIKSIRNMAEELEALCEDEFGVSNLPEVREVADKIADDAIMLKDRLTFRLEDALYDENPES